ncbi:lysylphosphatidylglycerol synthase transmembrane domain-containing protein [Paraliomyxa miuraensis]|uniref:lysylphosphatidylglycerol synthase transmembrane domain-containing protein n=1 Tax=Paraliomyxa miuraensis TaxID=376150 RepID=UPI00225407CA|nr:lysylphosphatidylglycerol synthase transmembrane domain-containing protein [Paraliomyxa miuraensis]MCX4245802.1 flippase-like domain-containing protein [Paraliomyxa miuraensis]
MPSPAPPIAPGDLESVERSRRGLWLRLGLSLLLAVAFAAALWPYLRAIPKDLTIAAWALPVFLGTLVPYHLLRAGRWHVLVRPLSAVPLSVTLRVSLAGYMWIALLPFRLGELARPLLLAQRSDVSMHRALGTVAIERVLDGLVICGLFFAASAGREGRAELAALQQATTGVMALFGVALLGLVFMARWPRAMGGLLDATVGRVLPRAGRLAAELSHGVAQGLAALPRGGALLAFVGLTLLYWGSNALGMWVLAHGCDLPLGLADAVLVMAVMNIALLVPGGPAQLGIFQTGVALGLHMVLPGRTIHDDGSTFAFYLYVVQLGTIVLGGWWSQRSLGLDWRAVLDRRATPATPDPPTEPSS